MVKSLFNYFVLALACCLSSSAWPATLSLAPEEQSVQLGQMFEINLNISGLGPNSPPSLSAFLVEVVFDPRVIDFKSAVFDRFLGDPANQDETDPVIFEDDGLVSLDNISFLLDAELDALQAADFGLATLVFSGLGPGSSHIAFEDADLSDEAGFEIDISGLNPASVTVVPLPAAFMLLASASLVLSFFGFRRGGP